MATEFRRTWRSWLWNSVLVIVFGAFFVVGLPGVVLGGDLVSKIMFAVIGFLGLLGAVRAADRRVVVRQGEIYMRNLFGSARIPLDAVQIVECVRGGEILPTYAPTVRLWRKVDTAPVAPVGAPGGSVELSVLSSYRRAPAQRVADELNALLAIPRGSGR